MQVINKIIFFVSLIMLFTVAAANTYIALADEDYTGGMFAASGFWFVIGFILFVNTKDSVIVDWE